MILKTFVENKRKASKKEAQEELKNHDFVNCPSCGHRFKKDYEDPSNEESLEQYKDNYNKGYHPEVDEENGDEFKDYKYLKGNEHSNE